MADDQQQDPAGGIKKSPLDILEELLKDSKGSDPDAVAGAAATAGDPASVPAAQVNEEAPLSPEEQAAIAAQQEAIRIADLQQMEQTKQGLIEIKQSDQYQARVQQMQEEVEVKKQQHKDLDGHEIHQLQHTKI